MTQKCASKSFPFMPTGMGRNGTNRLVVNYRIMRSSKQAENTDSRKGLFEFLAHKRWTGQYAADLKRHASRFSISPEKKLLYQKFIGKMG